MSSTALPPGTAPIKPEFLVSTIPRDVPDDDAAEGGVSHSAGRRDDPAGTQDAEGKALSGVQRKRMTREERKSKRGANKGRRFQKVRDDLELCWRVAVGKQCESGTECRFTHDIPAYLAAKPRDIHFPALDAFSSTPPFVHLPPSSSLSVHPAAEDVDVDMPAAYENPDAAAHHVPAPFPSIVPATTCPVFARTGECKQGFKCRFLGAHVRVRLSSAAADGAPGGGGEDGEEKTAAVAELLVDEERRAHAAAQETELNFIGADTLKLVRSKKYPHPISDAYLKELQEAAAERDDERGGEKEKAGAGDLEIETVAVAGETEPQAVLGKEKASGDKSQVDTPDVPLRPAEKKRLHWTGKTYLAPLTTVGNLPFRRLCVDYGADITCGEMGLALSFLQGSKEEWSLVRRHPAERTFGVQIAGSKPGLLVPAAEVIGRECAGNLDFIDVNCGCPIDLVYKTGSGSALLDAAGKLGKIVVGMGRALQDIPVTVKLRTGVKDGRNTAHKVMPRLATEFGASAITLHGRTRQQRYTKLADWQYIKQCVEAVRAREAEEGLEPVPIFGGGDCFSAADYWEKMEGCGVDGVMVGRGALIKPWVFTEIKERREWDISARERLELVRKYAEYGLNHFGSDTAGVNTTRRYLCEALSFQYRYIPIGLLETLPGRINDRAPAFRGRDELETLLASPDSRDWVKLSEMFLGPAPESWSFTPKHRSNAYGSEESQG